ncbi:MAG: hypothetical protein ABIN67_24895 [Ferruginibacter sp.]
MKTKLFYMTLPAFCLAMLLTSCDAGKLNSKAEESATAFYKGLQNKDYNAALNACSDKAFSKSTKEDWIKLFEKNAALIGAIKSYTKTSGFNIETSTNAGTTVVLSYDVDCQYGKSKDSIFLVKEKDGSMKVYRYVFKQHDVAYGKAMDAGEKIAREYIAAVKKHDYNTAIAFLSEDALKITPKDDWIGFLEKTNAKLGDIGNYTVIRDSASYNITATGSAGKGNYYDIYVETERARAKAMEKITFFQKNYDESAKLVGHDVKF